MRKAVVVAVLGLITLAAPPVAWAIDGVVLIDQNKALLGGVTPGDTPGFPVTITQPGSYKLASNLTSPINVSTIVIASDNVDLDLNGFTVTCTVTGANIFRLVCVISQGQIRNIGVHDGTLKGIQIGTSESPSFCAGGLDLLTASRILVHDVIVQSDACGMTIGSHAVIRNNVIDKSLSVTCPSLIVQNLNAGGQGQGGAGCLYVDNVGLSPF